jgi:hypothetical protein
MKATFILDLFYLKKTYLTLTGLYEAQTNQAYNQKLINCDQEKHF